MSNIAFSKLDLEFLRSLVQSENLRMASHKANITDQKVFARLEVRNKEIMRKIDDELDALDKLNEQFIR